MQCIYLSRIPNGWWSSFPYCVQYKTGNQNYFCECCGVWMADNPRVRAIHDNGSKHKENVAQSTLLRLHSMHFPLLFQDIMFVLCHAELRTMRQNAKNTERNKEYMARTIGQIESAAAKAYENDQQNDEMRKSSWKFHQESGYYYNSLYGWYYDVKSKIYYGGTPPDWTLTPNIPSAAHYGAVNPQVDPLLAATETESQPVRQMKSKYPSGMKISKVHPLAGIGGYQMPSQGSFGGLQSSVEPEQEAPKKKVKSKDSGRTTSGVKRKDDKDSKISKEEQEFMARREAARQRVQKRTMDAFGLK
jgi:WW domain-binding protein 4